MKLRDHIDNEHGGNISAFCRSTGVSHTQASRWLDYGCEWECGQVKRILWGEAVTKDTQGE